VKESVFVNDRLQVGPDAKAEFVANQRPIAYGRSNHAILAIDLLPGDISCT